MSDLAGSVDTKRTLRSLPAKRYDPLYYNEAQSKVELIENVATAGKYQINLSSPRYNTTSSITFPNLNFIGKVFLHLELPVPDFVANPGAILCQAWGLALINNLELLIGNSNISTQRIERTAMFHSMYSQKMIADDLLFDMDHAGLFCNATIFANSGISFTYNGNFVADVILDLPWSNYCQGEEDKLYFDTSILTAPITLNITFNPATAIWGNTYIPPSDSFTASMFYRQLELTNRNQSLRNTLFSNPGSVITYPSVYRQNFPVLFTGPPDEVTDVQVNLQSFLNADLLSMTLSAHLINDQQGTTIGGIGQPVNPFAPLDMFDPNLQFGGDTVFQIPKTCYQLINQEPNSGAVYLTNTYANTIAGPTQQAGTRRSYVLQIDFSRLRQMCNNTSFFNTIRLPKQVLQFTFKLKPNVYWFAGNTMFTKAVANQPCVLQCTYYYPMVTEVNSTGSVNIFYN